MSKKKTSLGVPRATGEAVVGDMDASEGKHL